MTKPPRPDLRRLRVYSFDPSLARRLATVGVSELTLSIPWETLAPGPINEYLAVVDVDPASGAAYAPVDLEDPHLLARDGWPPSLGNPQFHQQMVFAVAMSTIRHFETALGRRILWSPRRTREDGDLEDLFVQRLRIYPHAIREPNAYYSSARKALLFGYFPADPIETDEALPGGTVFTCLSHDVIAHETTHAILDGLHRRFIEPSNPDVLAFHEAFADIVALFQHFSHEEVLRDQIARTRGNLESRNLLGELAQEVGRSIGRRGALRDALGAHTGEDGAWEPRSPDPDALDETFEPHKRGGVLVAAIFGAFVRIYQSRVADLFRIATGGSGILPEGAIHPDLVKRLAEEAARSARHILKMSIRALDYCPPIDITFGDFLRALVTADRDLYPTDPWRYRVAIIESFQRWGIYPEGVKSMSEESLRWPPLPEPAIEELEEALQSLSGLSRATENLDEIEKALRARGDRSPEARDQLRDVRTGIERARRFQSLQLDWDLETGRRRIHENAVRTRALLQRALTNPPVHELMGAIGLTLAEDAPASVFRSRGGEVPALEVHSARPALRILSDGRTRTDLVIELTQRRRSYFDADEQRAVDRGRKRPGRGDFLFRGGATLLVDLESRRVRYAVAKGILDEERLERMRDYVRPIDDAEARAGRRSVAARASLRTTYFGDKLLGALGVLTDADSVDRGASEEPFAMIHGGVPGEGDI